MTDKRLSDLTVLVVQRDFDINYERVIDKFASNHKNCRILIALSCIFSFNIKVADLSTHEG